LAETDADQLEILDMFPEYRSGLNWTDVLARRRVVILAEAGSGKSKELAQKAIELQLQGKYAFIATLEDVGTRGLEEALAAKRKKFAEWKASDAEAWLFLDSIDEAKKARVRLSKALEAIALDIEGCETRTHIVLSGRHSDWDFRSDLSLIDELLKIPRELAPGDLAEPSVDEMVSQITEMQDEAPQEQTHEAAAVLLMLPLDAPRVRAFAIAQHVDRVELFLEQLKANNLMGLARRPLDLGWLSAHWREKGGFTPLSQMLALSLQKLATEVLPSARAHAHLTPDDAIASLDRIGAALVLQKLELLLIPDGGVAVQQHPRAGIVLHDVLSQLSPQQVLELLSRPVFIPVQEGVARLAQDNRGDVRSLLAARWLQIRITQNCPRAEIRSLLFATTYGEPVVIPSMQQTAAWLSIWDTDTGREVAARDPEILVQLGDPASLPDAIAEAALRTLVYRIAKGDRDRVSDHDQIRRLMRPALAAVVRELWRRHGKVEDVRSLLVKCIHNGRLRDLVDIAYEAATTIGEDRLCRVFGGRAVLDLAPPPLLKAYVAHVRQHFKTLPATMVWEVAEAAFPGELSADDIATFLDTLEEQHSEMYFERFLRSLEDKPVPFGDLLHILTALARRLPEDVDGPRHEHDDLAGSLAALCRTVYARLGTVEPPLELCNAFLRVTAFERMRKPDEPLRKAAQETPLRRRTLLWAAVEMVAADPDRKGRPDQVWSLHWLHYGPTLLEEDIDWLLVDIRTRPHAEDRRLAADAVFRIIGGTQDRTQLLERARSAAVGLPELSAFVEAWDRPVTRSADDLAFEAEQAARTKQNESEREENQKKWREFFDGIRANPEQLRDINPLANEDHVEYRIYRMYDFASRSKRNRDRYALEDLKPLEKQVGSDATLLFRAALARFWRQWTPTLKSSRPPNQRNSMVNFDIMGIAGITLEAASNPNWVDSLTEAEARRAAGYATLELNGFPRWIDALAARWPDVVREVLGRELESEIQADPPLEHLGELQDVSHSSPAIQALTADTLYRLLIAQPNMPIAARGRIISILQSTAHAPRELGDYLLQRTRHGKDPAALAADLDGLFRIAPAQAVGALKATLARIPKSKRDDLVRIVLTSICGDGWGKPSEVPATLAFQDLVDLMKLCFVHVRAKEDVRPPRGAVWRRGPSRTDAEHARNSLIGYLTKRSGQATYDVLRSLAREPHSPFAPAHVLHLARQRAEGDSEYSAWASGDVTKFEAEHTFSPQSSRDLCRHALAVLENLQHQLIHADFQQGRVLARLNSEDLVQNWVAEQFRLRAGNRFSVERESQVADAKEPDIRLRVSSAQASTAIEVKVAESWSVPDLEKALTDQLVKKYLRDEDHRWGALLLVHLKPKRWVFKGKRLTFSDVVKRLTEQAKRISGRAPASPQPFVAVLNVSTLAPKPKAPKQARPAKAVRRTRLKRAKKASMRIADRGKGK